MATRRKNRDVDEGIEYKEVSVVEYLEIMRERHPDPTVGVAPNIMPPSYDEKLLDPKGWDCEHVPPHGVRLRADELFVRTRHFPTPIGIR